MSLVNAAADANAEAEGEVFARVFDAACPLSKTVDDSPLAPYFVEGEGDDDEEDDVDDEDAAEDDCVSAPCSSERRLDEVPIFPEPAISGSIAVIAILLLGGFYWYRHKRVIQQKVLAHGCLQHSGAVEPSPRVILYLELCVLLILNLNDSYRIRILI